MRLGYHGFGLGPSANGAAAARVARHAEALGYESLWTAEHVVLPSPQAPPSPAPPELPFLDPAGVLCYAAAVTERIRLATGIVILPQRNPLVLAKELATVDVLSSGRLIFGVGVGYLEAEFDALGVPFENKGPRTDEYLGRHHRDVDAEQARLLRALRFVLRHRRAASAGAEAAPADRDRRPQPGRVSTRRALRQRLVRLLPRRRGHAAVPRGTRGGGSRGRAPRRSRPPRDQRHAANQVSPSTTPSAMPTWASIASFRTARREPWRIWSISSRGRRRRWPASSRSDNR